MAAKSDPMIPHLYRIEKRRKETEDTFTVVLTPDGSNSIAHFKPGQFNMLYVFGVGEVPISISGDPSEPDVMIHTVRSVGTVTAAMKNLKQGMVIGLRGPYGNAWPVEESAGDDIVLIAGGIGLAPLRPALYRILARREKYGKVILLYGARTPQEILYRKELENWRKRFDLEVLVTVDRATGNWRGNVGVVTKLIPRVAFDPYHTTAMVCGPEVMMRYSAMALEEQGLPLHKIHISMERNMKCAIGFCGHCQYGPHFICKDGPVFRFDQLQPLFTKREI